VVHCAALPELCCSVLQRVAACCIVVKCVQCSAVFYIVSSTRSRVLNCAAGCCTALQSVAVCCNVLQYACKDMASTVLSLHPETVETVG